MMQSAPVLLTSEAGRNHPRTGTTPKKNAPASYNFLLLEEEEG